jgi:hypothetical protein
MDGSNKPTILLAYDVALGRLLRSRRLKELVDCGALLHFIGYPTLIPSERVLAELSDWLGCRVVPPPALELKTYQGLYEKLSNMSRECEVVLGRADVSESWLMATASDRVTYRLAPVYKVESYITQCCERGAGVRLILPWHATRFDTVERPGLARLDAPGHELRIILDRLTSEGRVRLESLWGDQTRRERVVLGCARIANATVRWADRASRAVKGAGHGARLRKRATAISETGDGIGFLVDGAATFQSLRPLLDSARNRGLRTVVLVREQVRSPTARLATEAAGEAFVPIDAFLGPLSLAKEAASQIRIAHRVRRRLAVAARDGDVERARVLMADVPMLPFLGIYRKQIEAAICELGLRTIITANMVDSYFGTARDACRRHGIPLVGIQNGCNELIRFPRAPNCDLYFCESAKTAAFLRSGDTEADVRAIGLPYYDELVTGRQGEPSLIDQMPWLAGRRIVGVTTQPDGVDLSPVLTKLVSAVETRPDLGIVVKLHPRQPADAYADLVSRLRGSGSGGCVQSMPIGTFLRGCHAMVSCFSSTVLWSIIAGVRPFTYIPATSRRVEDLSYMNDAVTFRSTDASAVVAEAINGVRDEDGLRDWATRRDRFVATTFDGVDGRACERILDVILEVRASASSSRVVPTSIVA